MTDLPQDALRDRAEDVMQGLMVQVTTTEGHHITIHNSWAAEIRDVIAALRQQNELLEANLHVQGEYLAGALADVERAERDALRYHVLRDNVCGSTMGHFSFAWFPKLPTNWRQGSIAQHFDAALDAIAANTTPQRAPEGQT